MIGLLEFKREKRAANQDYLGSVRGIWKKISPREVDIPSQLAEKQMIIWIKFEKLVAQCVLPTHSIQVSFPSTYLLDQWYKVFVQCMEVAGFVTGKSLTKTTTLEVHWVWAFNLKGKGKNTPGSKTLCFDVSCHVVETDHWEGRLQTWELNLLSEKKKKNSEIKNSKVRTTFNNNLKEVNKWSKNGCERRKKIWFLNPS